MANLKEIRTRISSVASTKQITNAMKMVSASKLRRAQDAIIQIRPYANKLQEILADVSDSLVGDEDNLYSQVREIEKVLFVLITSNKGLCGAFNSNITKASINLANEEYGNLLRSGNLHFLSIGRHGGDYLTKRQYTVVDKKPQLLNDLRFENVKPLGEDLITKYVSGEYDKIIVLYNQFKNAAVQIITAEQFLPIELPEEDQYEEHHTYLDYIFEPSKHYIVTELIPRSLKIQLYKALLDSNAAEHGARMTAMHQATDNATELLKDLRLNYNKARQASITNEILEIVSGAEALRG
ncbi:MAG: ATP synthase F1 subunit gamma [Bacteroidales bacterium]|nr:ATP synthase F1 subunit gamma [Bacteroidales bacterium]